MCVNNWGGFKAPAANHKMRHNWHDKSFSATWGREANVVKIKKIPVFVLDSGQAHQLQLEKFFYPKAIQKIIAKKKNLKRQKN